MATTITYQVRFACGDLVHVNQGGGRFVIEAWRHTFHPCRPDRLDYLISGRTGAVWVPAQAVTLANEPCAEEWSP